MNVVLQMVTALITAILLGQLWLFTVTLDAMENHAVSMNVAIAAAVCSLAGVRFGLDVDSILSDALNKRKRGNDLERR